jgi:hypothetical protein
MTTALYPSRNITLPFLRWPSEDAKTWVSGFVNTIESTPSIDALIAIGSAVRPGVTSSMDIDLVLITSGEKPNLRGITIDVDVRVFPTQEVDKLICQGNDLLIWTVNYGVLIWERNKAWSDLIARWRTRLPLPSSETALERARKAEAHVRHLTAVGDIDAAAEQEVSMLTHLARAKLIDRGIQPASRPELPTQLRAIGENTQAERLSTALKGIR